MATPTPQILLTLFITSSLLASLCVGRNVLYSRERLSTGKSLVYKQYSLVMQGDCNLVAYDGRNPIWASGTYGKGDHCYLKLHSNGNLTIYKPTDDGLPSPVWSTDTGSSKGGYALVLQYDGTLRVYGPTIWSAGSSHSGGENMVSARDSVPTTTDSVLFTGDVAPIGTTIVNGDYALVLEGGCNLVLNNTSSGAVLWQTGTANWLHDCFINLDATGALKIKYMGGETLWTNGVASGYGEYVLALSPRGKLALYGPAIWAGTKSASVAVAGDKIAMVTEE